MALGEDFVKAIKHKTDEKASQVKQVKKDINAIMGVKKVDASLKKTKYSTLLASLKALKTFVEEHTSGDELINPLKEIKKIFAGGYSEKIADTNKRGLQLMWEISLVKKSFLMTDK